MLILVDHLYYLYLFLFDGYTGYVPDPNETPNAKLAIFSGGFIPILLGWVVFWMLLGVAALGGSLGWAHSPSFSNHLRIVTTVNYLVLVSITIR